MITACPCQCMRRDILISTFILWQHYLTLYICLPMSISVCNDVEGVRRIRQYMKLAAHSLTHSLIHSFTHSLTHYSLTPFLTPSLPPSLPHALTLQIYNSTILKVYIHFQYGRFCDFQFPPSSNCQWRHCCEHPLWDPHMPSWWKSSVDKHWWASCDGAFIFLTHLIYNPRRNPLNSHIRPPR